MPTFQPRSTARFSTLVGSLLLTACAFISINPASAADAQPGSNYEKERAACLNGSSNQDRATCLKEAGAAREEAARGKLNDPAQTQYRQNALTRCKALPDADRIECEKRIDGSGVTQGNPMDGGVLRENVTIVPGTLSK
ncbi:hypothetical protein PQR62_10515 [Herbaspirillum lusitanum]|uniref:PsiF repeat-containing protein n=1 Tax=Herbaspirillum lusitanum TaxID=213312 RepID=A0ABW9A751_9BURK